MNKLIITDFFFLYQFSLLGWCDFAYYQKLNCRFFFCSFCLFVWIMRKKKILGLNLEGGRLNGLRWLRMVFWIWHFYLFLIFKILSSDDVEFVLNICNLKRKNKMEREKHWETFRYWKIVWLRKWREYPFLMGLSEGIEVNFQEKVFNWPKSP